MALASAFGDGLSLQELADLYLESLRADIEGRTETPSGWTEPSTQGRKPRAGDLWVTRGQPGDLPVLVALTWVGDGIGRGVVVLEEPELAASDDILVPAEQSPLGSPFALCCWSDLPVSEVSLDALVGELPWSVTEPLAMLLQQRLTGGFRRRALGGTRLSTGESAVSWLIEPEDGSAPGCEYLTGALIVKDGDPRTLVRLELRRLTTYLEHDALKDLEVETVLETQDSRPIVLAERPMPTWARSALKKLESTASFTGPIKITSWAEQRPLRAAASSARLDTHVDLPEGFLDLRIDRSGRGVARAAFRQPSHVHLTLADEDSGEILFIGVEGEEPRPALLLPADRRLTFTFDVASWAHPLDRLRALVFSYDAPETR